MSFPDVVLMFTVNTVSHDLWIICAIDRCFRDSWLVYVLFLILNFLVKPSGHISLLYRIIMNPLLNIVYLLYYTLLSFSMNEMYYYTVFCSDLFYRILHMESWSYLLIFGVLVWGPTCCVFYSAVSPALISRFLYEHTHSLSSPAWLLVSNYRAIDSLCTIHPYTQAAVCTTPVNPARSHYI